jgi:hypothetical protein
MATPQRSPEPGETVFMPEAATTLPLAPRRVSWGAIIAGMVIAVVVQLVLSLAGAGVGLGAFDPLGYSSPDASTFGISAAIWWAISSVVALFIGGWVAGHLCGSPEKTDAVLHGLLTWGVGTIVTVYLITAMVSSVLRGGAAVVGKSASLAATGAAAIAAPSNDPMGGALAAPTDVSPESLHAQVAILLAPAGNAASQADTSASQPSAAASETSAAPAVSAASASSPAAQDLKPIVQRITASGRDTVDPADRDAMVEIVAARTGLPRADAEQRVDAWVRQYQDTRSRLNQQKAQSEANARQLADDAASASAKGALGAAAALVLGAVAGALGGLAGRRRPRVFVGSTHAVAR